MSTRNEAAAGLRRLIHAVAMDEYIYESESGLVALLNRALAVERRNVVEQVRPYLRHHLWCRQIEGGISILDDGTIIPACDCGLDSIATGTEEEGK